MSAPVKVGDEPRVVRFTGEVLTPQGQRTGNSNERNGAFTLAYRMHLDIRQGDEITDSEMIWSVSLQHKPGMPTYAGLEPLHIAAGDGAVVAIVRFGDTISAAAVAVDRDERQKNREQVPLHTLVSDKEIGVSVESAVVEAKHDNGTTVLIRIPPLSPPLAFTLQEKDGRFYWKQVGGFEHNSRGMRVPSE